VDQRTPDGTVRRATGKYLNVWKKQPDGSWKVLVDIGNEDPVPDSHEE
jgi:ketosteroid isomerase-like protein